MNYNDKANEKAKKKYIDGLKNFAIECTKIATPEYVTDLTVEFTKRGGGGYDGRRGLIATFRWAQGGEHLFYSFAENDLHVVRNKGIWPTFFEAKTARIRQLQRDKALKRLEELTDEDPKIVFLKRCIEQLKVMRSDFDLLTKPFTRNDDFGYRYIEHYRAVEDPLRKMIALLEQDVGSST